MTMTLHWSPRSPYVRKVMITLHETGLLPEVALQRSVVALHLPPNAAVLADNPLGKIPALVTGDGPALFDSRVICEYLDLRAKAGFFRRSLPRASGSCAGRPWATGCWRCCCCGGPNFCARRGRGRASPPAGRPRFRRP
ncbi:glutathione S-transferase N-terminal domain-containing protein [Salipiger marinus]|uniref:glutathione S-transferase N-terminal domain-containing protein n=1 Tax=Salipiger marinus TaxID=555512 RepID=UPI003639E0E5